jgi:uncharacterized iron-regulated protein
VASVDTPGTVAYEAAVAVGRDPQRDASVGRPKPGRSAVSQPPLSLALPARAAITGSRGARTAPSRWLVGVAVASWSVACAAPAATLPPAAQPPAAQVVDERVGGPWSSNLSVDHPLVGRIYRPSTKSFVSVRELEKAVREGGYALLGEQHDNPDHHRLQARLVQVAAEGKPPPIVAWEMFDTEQQPALDAFVAAHGEAPHEAAAALGPALAFEQSGWPAWEMYAPIAEVAFAAHLPLVGANLSRKMAKGLVFQGVSVLPEGALGRLQLDRPMAPAALESLKKELSDAHCGHLPASHTDAMVLAQRARDATLAEELLHGSQRDGRGGRGVLIAGAGHVRTDRGVAALLRETMGKNTRARPVVAVAFVEVDPHENEPAPYAERFHPMTDGAGFPFDFVWFTPRTSDEDPCAAMLAPPKKAAATPGADAVARRLSFEAPRAPGDFGLPKDSAPRRQALVELAVWNEGGRGPDTKWHPQPRVVISEPIVLGAGSAQAGSKKAGKKSKKGSGKKTGGKPIKKVDESADKAALPKRTGGWDTHGAMRALRKYGYSGVRRCFDTALRDTPELEGRTVVDIQVDGSGHIVSAKTSRGRAPDPRKHQTGMSSGPVRSCIATALRSVAVPPAHGKRVSARVSVDLWPGDAPLPAAEPPALQNSLPPAAFAPWFAAQRPAVEACFGSLAQREPNTWGRLVLRVDVDAEGAVQASEFDSTFPDSATVLCVTKALAEASRSLPAHPTPSRVVLAMRLERTTATASLPPPEVDDQAEESPPGTADESSESPAPRSN